MRARTVIERFSICLVAMLLVAFMATPAFADEILPTLDVSDEAMEATPPTIAEFEHYGPKTLDTSREAISQASTHIATPEQALRAEETTTTASVSLSEPAMTTTLAYAGDSVMEGMVVALGALVIVAFSLLLYHFRKE